jgi:HEAT repeat protein
MKIKFFLLLAVGLILAVVAGSHFASAPVPPVVKTKPVPKVSAAPVSIVQAALETGTPPLENEANALAPSQVWSQARTFEELDQAASLLAERSTAESVQTLLAGIQKTQDWSQRAALAKNLRAVSDPESLMVLVPALLDNYGRGSTILGEIVDVIARLAQPETVDDLAALHWQASTQAGQGHKVLRAVAAIRNPAAMRGLVRLTQRADSPALAAAAEEAVKRLQETALNQTSAQ